MTQQQFLDGNYSVDNLTKMLLQSRKIIGCLVVTEEEDGETAFITMSPVLSSVNTEMFENLCKHLTRSYATLDGPHPDIDWVAGIVMLSEAIKQQFPQIAQAVRECNIKQLKKNNKYYGD